MAWIGAPIRYIVARFQRSRTGKHDTVVISCSGFRKRSCKRHCVIVRGQRDLQSSLVAGIFVSAKASSTCRHFGSPPDPQHLPFHHGKGDCELSQHMNNLISTLCFYARPCVCSSTGSFAAVCATGSWELSQVVAPLFSLFPSFPREDLSQ